MLALFLASSLLNQPLNCSTSRVVTMASTTMAIASRFRLTFTELTLLFFGGFGKLDRHKKHHPYLVPV